MIEETRYIDLFSGIGGFRLGLDRVNKISGNKQLRAGDKEGSNSSLPQSSTEHRFSCVWSNDIDKYANQIYTARFGEKAHYSGNIRGVDSKEIPAHDLICGGFPCQSFSTAGKSKGFKDTRGTLFYEICRIAEHHRPDLLFLENVRGLLGHDGGRTFAVILKSLEELGYWWEYQVLNSKDYGVPQNRERVFIIGHLREGCTKPIFPITKNDQTPERKGIQNVRPLSAGGNSGGLHSDMTMIIDSYNVAERKDGLAGTIKTNEGSPSSSGTVLGVPLANFSRYEGVNRTPYKKGGVSWALNAAGDQGVLENKIIRRLTPIECERLQGFPDGWTEYGYLKGNIITTEPVYDWRETVTEPDGDIERRWVKVGEKGIDPIPDSIRISDTQRYKCLGNAVTVNVIEFLGHKLRESINSKSLRTDKP